MKSIKKILRTWLEVPTVPEIKDWTDEFEKLEKRTWKYEQILKNRVVTKCPVCGKKLYLWPMETEAYYVKDGQAYHTECYKVRK